MPVPSMAAVPYDAFSGYRRFALGEREVHGQLQVYASVQLAVNALFRLRAAQGVLGLADKYTAARLEAACARAIAVGDTLRVLRT